MSLSDKDLETAYFVKLLGGDLPNADEIKALAGGRLSESRIDRIVKRISDRRDRLTKPFTKYQELKANKAASRAS